MHNDNKSPNKSSTGAKVAAGAVLGGAAVAAGAIALNGDEVSEKEKEI
jgi:uncharacterized protein involved in exopolysaccharide biosynthesis